VTGSEITVEIGVANAPSVRMLDARLADLDGPCLQEWARTLPACAGSPFVSRSYRYPYALVAWHNGPVGIDIERIGPCDSAFAELICTPAERADPAYLAEPDTYLTSLWSAKEALSKALGDARLYVPSRLDSPTRWHRLRSGPWRAARIPVSPGHVGWACWRSAP
jgi:hypothetical protein